VSRIKGFFRRKETPPPDSRSMGSSLRSGAPRSAIPAVFSFSRGTLYRQVNRSYRPTFDRLEQSGLAAELVADGLLIPHAVSGAAAAEPSTASLVLQPEPLDFISYPYEWSFRSRASARALTTLEIQARALARDLSLKDASAYNIQFHHGRPLLIDTLSFEIYRR
jgi:hypothetical protein